jgi:hypothetical protein
VPRAVSDLVWALRSAVNARGALCGARAQQPPPPPPSAAAQRAFALLEPHLDAFSRQLLAGRLG